MVRPQRGETKGEVTPRLALRASLWSVSRDPARRAGTYDTFDRLRAPARPTSPLLPSTTRRSLRLPWRSPTGAERDLQSERRGVEGRREHVGRAGARRRPIVSHAPAWCVKAREVDRRSDRSANRGGEGHCWSGRKGGKQGGVRRAQRARRWGTRSALAHVTPMVCMKNPDRVQAGAARVFSAPRGQAPSGDDGRAARAIAQAVSRRCVAMLRPCNAPYGCVARSGASMTCVIAAL